MTTVPEEQKLDADDEAPVCVELPLLRNAGYPAGKS